MQKERDWILYLPSKFEFRLTCVVRDGPDSIILTPRYFSSWDLPRDQRTQNSGGQTCRILVAGGVVHMKDTRLGAGHGTMSSLAGMILTFMGDARM